MREEVTRVDSLKAVHDPPDSNVGVVLGTLVLADGGVAEGVASSKRCGGSGSRARCHGGATRKGRGGRKGRGSWHGGDGRAACGCDCGGDISRIVLKKGIFVVSESVIGVKVGSRKATTTLCLLLVRLATALPRQITATPALNACARATTHRIAAGERRGASVRSGDESPILHY